MNLPLRNAAQALFGSVIVAGAFAFACSASQGEDPTGDPGGNNTGGSGSTGLKLPGNGNEICGNGIDDNDNGQIDEGCGGCTKLQNGKEVPGSNCTGGGSSTGGSGSGNGSGGTSTGGAPATDAGGCVSQGPTETNCDDGKDDDCDGTVDCSDPDCRHPGSCGCRTMELYCNDGQDDDCDGKPDCSDEDCPKCVAGAQRFCDEPTYCNWGIQTCGPDGYWGACTEIAPPAGCEGPFGFPTGYDQDCCVSQGLCCQAYPANQSVGNCAGIATGC